MADPFKTDYTSFGALTRGGVNTFKNVLDPIGFLSKGGGSINNVFKNALDPAGIFGGKAKPYMVDKQGNYILNGKRGGKDFYSGSISAAGKVIPGKGMTPEMAAKLQAALDSGDFSGLPKQANRFIKAAQAMRSANPQLQATAAGRENWGQAPAQSGPFQGFVPNPIMQAYQNQLPQMLQNQSLFARPGAAAFLAQQNGLPPPQWAGGPAPAPAPAPNGVSPVVEAPFMSQPGFTQPGQPGYVQPQPGMMYAGGNPNFNEMAGATPGPAPDLQSIMAQYQGTLGNGGGDTRPMSLRYEQYK